MPSADTVTLIFALSVGSVAFVAVQAIGVPGALTSAACPAGSQVTVTATSTSLPTWSATVLSSWATLSRRS